MITSLQVYSISDAPPARQVPVVFDSPHSGTDIPVDFDYSAPQSAMSSAVDWYVDALYGSAPAFGAALLAARFPRTYVDPNRNVADIDIALIDGDWPGPVRPGPKTESGMGLLRRLALPGVPVHDRLLSVAEAVCRIENYYEPYRAALQRLLDARHARFDEVWFVDCHSMKSVGNAMNTDAGAPRPDVVLGDGDGTSCAPEFTALVAEAFRELGYSAAINDPYRGADLVQTHGDPNAGRHSLQIELNRSLYLDETTFNRTTGFDRLQQNLTRVVAAVCEFAKARAQSQRAAP